MIADPAGVGKTLPALLAARNFTPIGSICLYVTLASAKYQLENEIKRFNVDFTPIVLNGTRTKREIALEALKNNQKVSAPVCLIINYEEILKDYRELANLPVTMIVADEAIRLGRQTNKTWKLLYAIANYTKAKKIAMSGSPITNNPLEAWALFEYLNPGSVGRWFPFAQRFMAATQWSMVGAVRRDRLPELAKLLAPYYLRREREVLLPDLPELMEETVPIELSATEQKLYDYLVMELLFDIEQSKIDRVTNPHNLGLGIVKFGKLRQLCVNPQLLGSGNPTGAKLFALREFIGTINDSKALIFTEFASAVPSIVSALPEGTALSITGSTPQSARAEIISKFQNGTDSQFLVMTRAGEMALNLQAASFVIHVDPPLTYASYDQRCSRARRQGRKDKVVSVRLVIKGSLEERIYKLISRKQLISLEAMPYNELIEELIK